MKKVTGIGGVFFKSDNPQQLNAWYAQHLGLDTSAYGTTFEWQPAGNAAATGSTTWCTFPQEADNFRPSTKPFMINYRVADLVGLVEELRQANVRVVDEIAEYAYGKFVHVLDPEGNILELWEPAGEDAAQEIAGATA